MIDQQRAEKAEDDRSQHVNRQLAFGRMVNTKEFKQWHRLEVMRRTGQQAIIDDQVKRQMRQIRVEVKEDGKWKEVNKDATLSDQDCG
jgi:hypothetical protein